MSGTHLVTGDYRGERIPYEASPANIPQGLVTGETFPQRLVARERRKCSPGKKAIVVVLEGCLQLQLRFQWLVDECAERFDPMEHSQYEP
ncbi:hypothetical protein Tco_0446731 [Tanacetum coccineum]